MSRPRLGKRKQRASGKVVVIRVMSASVSAPRSVIETRRSASSRAAAMVSAISSQRSW